MNERMELEINECLSKIIRNFTFKYLISFKFLREITNEANYKTVKEEYDDTGDAPNCILKFYRILSNFLIDKSLAQKNPLYSPKIYDEEIKEAQIRIYNKMCKQTGDIPISTCYSYDVLKSALLMDNPNQSIDYEILEKIAPYVLTGERNKFSFLEAILYTVLYNSTNGSSTRTLSHPSGDSSSARSRTKMWFKKIKEELFSREIYECLLLTIMDEIYTHIIDKYNIILEPYLREYYIAPEYSHRKDLNRLLKNHQIENHELDEPKIKIEISNSVKVSYDVGDEKFKKQKSEVDSFALIIYSILPITEQILLGNKVQKFDNTTYFFENTLTYSIFTPPASQQEEQEKRIKHEKLLWKNEIEKLNKEADETERMLEEQGYKKYSCQNEVLYRKDNKAVLVSTYSYIPDKHFFDTEYNLAQNIAKTIRQYIDLSLEEAINLLSFLPKAEITGTESVYNFLKKL